MVISIVQYDNEFGMRASLPFGPPLNKAIGFLFFLSDIVFCVCFLLAPYAMFYNMVFRRRVHKLQRERGEHHYEGLYDAKACG